MERTYITPSMEPYGLPDDQPAVEALALCEQCALALAGHTTADTGDPATDESAFWMEDQWGYPYTTTLLPCEPVACSSSRCDGCATSEPGRRHAAISQRIA
ncbi:hypothetical protein Bra3105_18485 (plasmid) [Brachybacterium halotolerans subsp. kimchii]|uniref:hypothetical protein n=1 Tax=Brachybacterium halotolerans TaxID=2795215 RepID=UPI001E572553|nr:hypothetical protein [Brachybacterium halotolerans]UEJ84620.1 hypothetical protein Bra3105_18485 [Brachybacterium halotolerans subsp. kimchii]